jgi:hypothetical protein
VGSVRADVVEISFVVVAAFSLGTDLAHDLDSLHGVRTVSGLSRKRDRVGTIKDCVSNIRGLCTSRRWVRYHRFEHLKGSDHGLCGDDSAFNKVLLSNEDFLCRDFEA